MTYFEKRGVEKQEFAETFEMAKREMQHSCKMCVTTGRRTRCENCAIAAAFERIYIDDLREEMERQNKKGA